MGGAIVKVLEQKPDEKEKPHLRSLSTALNFLPELHTSAFSYSENNTLFMQVQLQVLPVNRT